MARTEPQPSIERRVRWTAAITLGTILAAHTLMETGRDALFLANIPAERLPWVYIAGALLALAVVRVSGATKQGASPARRLTALQALAATSVFGFWWAMSSPGPWLYYALYVWSGVITSAVVVTFWVLMAEFFTVTQAKQLFAGIAMGGSMGAVVGAGLATAITPHLSAETLLLSAAILFAGSALGPLMLPPEPEAEPEYPPEFRADAPSESGTTGLRAGIRQIVTHPYASRVALLIAVATAALTLGDYLFKSVLVEEVPADQLSVWLARVYLGLNLLSIGVLAVGVRPLISRFGVDRALLLLPVLIAVSTVGILLGIALASVVLLKTADGTLRHSLHKTATEILYLPMDSSLRNSVKGVIDLLASSTAKAVASIVILALTALPQPRFAIAGLLLVLTVVWGLFAVGLRRPYLDVFRRTLRRGSIETRIDFPELDLDSVGSLLRALSSPDPRVVLAAMELLHERNRCSLIPSLILYHPSPDVVAHAIDVFAAAGREEVLDFTDRLLDHEYARVRSAIVRAAAVLAPNREQLEAFEHSTCPCTRVSAVAGLLAQGWIDSEHALLEIRSAARHHEPDTRIAVANAAKLSYDEIFREPLDSLAGDPDLAVAREAIRAMHRSQDPWFTASLVRRLDDRRIRDGVRDALLDRGDEALRVLADALVDPETAPSVLRHVPRTISRFPASEAVDVLLQGLEDVESGIIRYKILRGLQPLLLEAAPVAGGQRIVEELHRTVARALFLLHREATLQHGHEADASRKTVGGSLLVDLLRDKRRLATGRVFLLLSLLHPDEDFRKIRAGIRSERARSQASGIELLESLLSRELRQAVLGLVSPGAAAERLARAHPVMAERRPDYEEAVCDLAEDSSQAVRAFAMYHASEVSVAIEPDEAASPPTHAAEAARGRRAPLRERALSIIERLPEALARRGSRTHPATAG